MDALRAFENLFISYYYGSFIRVGESWGEKNVVLPCSKLYYITDGECFVQIDGTVYHGTEGSLLLIPEGVRHSYGNIKGGRVQKYWFHFSVQSGGRSIFDQLRLPVRIQVGRDEILERLFASVVANGGRNSLAGQFHVQADILSIISYIIDRTGADFGLFPNESSIDEVLRYINLHLSEPLSIEKLASIAHLHPNYFIRHFKSRYGVTPAKYVKRLRLEKAKSMLENTAVPLSDIMQATGFEDASHFSKYFKSFTGYPPRKFRELFQKTENQPREL